LANFNKRIASDVEFLKAEKNKRNILKVLAKNNLACDQLDMIKSWTDQIHTIENLEKIVGLAVSNHLMTHPLENPIDANIPTENNIDKVEEIQKDDNSEIIDNSTTIDDNKNESVVENIEMKDLDKQEEGETSKITDTKNENEPKLKISFQSIEYGISTLKKLEPENPKSVIVSLFCIQIDLNIEDSEGYCL
jgi:hypothetical protein